MSEMGVEIDCIEDSCIVAKALPHLVSIYGGSLGIDLGTSWVGIAFTSNGDLMLGARISSSELSRVLNALHNVERSINIYVGGTPYVDPTTVIKRMEKLCSVHRVFFVDELEASKLRGTFKERYPGLVEDVLDALIFTYVGGIALKLC